ncbi:glycoside hydrolase [Anaerobacillus alkalilacustris]|uniref:Glycoside hydrolase n=1 Tax=Anaerobacillus alkalilacustris TaxID=393763 RepID=A0A1S2LRC2_9BACI|nr:glycoside hydrolase 43 family protein [Anaerobacillus alkalilacustris]OIJ14673.1 glycoside hydrolase [Anaerobacillus alkalilacustris]
METKISSNHVWSADLGNGYYQNPILYADYSDPDVIRVGKDFFMVSSSFNMSPCLPILHSTDLVNWKIVNHVCEKFPFEGYDKPRHGDGVWAPSIRYHDGFFWVFFGAPDEGIFMSKTKDPFGKWSPLHLVKKVKGWIDACPFWDEDGQAYLVNAFARSRIGFKSILHISRMKPDGTELLDDGVHIFDGNLHHETIEGPKMYKLNGYYYIFAPAGGVATGWQTILRSKSIFGPYEDKIVLHKGETEINGPHQGGWVELENGENWFIHFQDKGAYGRITHLQPMKWENDWPVMGYNVNQNGIGEPVIRWKKPNVSALQNEIIIPQTSDEFDGTSLGLQWQWRANQNHEWYQLGVKESQLRLFASSLPEDAETLYDAGQILTQKLPAPDFSATTKLAFHPERNEDYCGLMIFGLKYSGIKLRKSETGVTLLHFIGENNDEITVEKQEVIAEVNSKIIYLKVDVSEGAVCQFKYSYDNESYQSVGQPFIATEGKWVGAQVGIFCVNKGKKESQGYVDVDWFRIK